MITETYKDQILGVLSCYDRSKSPIGPFKSDVYTIYQEFGQTLNSF